MSTIEIFIVDMEAVDLLRRHRYRVIPEADEDGATRFRATIDVAALDLLRRLNQVRLERDPWSYEDQTDNLNSFQWELEATA